MGLLTDLFVLRPREFLQTPIKVSRRELTSIGVAYGSVGLLIAFFVRFIEILKALLLHRMIHDRSDITIGLCFQRR